MKEFPIYVEGYAATGQRGGAKRVCSARGETFGDACVNAYMEGKFEGYGNFDATRLTLWGCKLFSNWNDASRSFG